MSLASGIRQNWFWIPTLPIFFTLMVKNETLWSSVFLTWIKDRTVCEVQCVVKIALVCTGRSYLAYEHFWVSLRKWSDSHMFSCQRWQWSTNNNSDLPSIPLVVFSRKLCIAGYPVHSNSHHSKEDTVSPLHVNLQVANFERCECVFRHEWNCSLPSISCCWVFHLYHLPPSLF